MSDAEKIVRLWALLDDIDTLDDACRDNDAAFRLAVGKTQRRRFEIVSGEEWDRLRATLPKPADAP